MLAMEIPPPPSSIPIIKRYLHCIMCDVVKVATPSDTRDLRDILKNNTPPPIFYICTHCRASDDNA